MKKLICLILALVMILSLTACSGTATPVKEPDIEPAETAGAYYPIEITDQAGRTITIEKEPKRLVSAYYITTSTIMALGLTDRLVGIEDNPQKRPVYGFSAPELLELPNVGNPKDFDLEGCIALEPDLVILPLKLKSIVETLEQMDITVMLVNPETQEQLIGMLDIISTAANVKDNGAKLIEFITEQENYLAAISGDAPSVYLAGNASMLTTAGKEMYQSHMITLAGGRNVAEELDDTYWAEISYEQLLTWDPEYIVLAADATYSVEDVLNDPNLTDCTAVKNGNVIHLPSKAEAWDSPVPSGILGAVWLASVLHEDVVSSEYANNTIDTYYQEFYGFNYSEK